MQYVLFDTFNKVFQRDKFSKKEEIEKVLKQNKVDDSIGKNLHTKKDFESKIKELETLIEEIDLSIIDFEMKAQKSRDKNKVTKVAIMINNGIITYIQNIMGFSTLSRDDGKIKFGEVVIKKNGYAKYEEGIGTLKSIRSYSLSQILSLSTSLSILSAFEDNMLVLSKKIDDLKVLIDNIAIDAKITCNQVDYNSEMVRRIMLKLDDINGTEV